MCKPSSLEQIYSEKHIDYFLYVCYYQFIRKKGAKDMGENIYEAVSKKLKAISDQKRLKIVDMLSCGELCACEILEKFDITQPTLSSDMKKLEEAKLVTSRREGKNTYYTLNKKALEHFLEELQYIFGDKPDCICHSEEKIDY